MTNGIDTSVSTTGSISAPMGRGAGVRVARGAATP